jgi:hypothetical protein
MSNAGQQWGSGAPFRADADCVLADRRKGDPLSDAQADSFCTNESPHGAKENRLYGQRILFRAQNGDSLRQTNLLGDSLRDSFVPVRRGFGRKRISWGIASATKRISERIALGVFWGISRTFRSANNHVQRDQAVGWLAVAAVFGFLGWCTIP